MKKPYEFTGDYKDCFVDPKMAMDKRHIYLMHDILCHWPFESALEIGSFVGASGTAFVEAINKGAAMQAMFCDITLMPNLHKVLGNCKDQSRVETHRGKSVEALGSERYFDFVFVDGDHSLEGVKPEIEHLMRRRPLCVMGHDTNNTAIGYPMSEGALALKKKFLADAEYLCLEDKTKRDGEWTERGLFFATTNVDLFNIAKGIYDQWK